MAVVGEDLSALVRVSGSDDGPTSPDDKLKMLLYRYPDPTAAAKAAASTADGVDVELVVSTDQSGRRRVSDPRFGSAALGRSNVLSWGALGLL